MNSIKNSLLKSRLAKTYSDRGQDIINEVIVLNNYKYCVAPFYVVYSNGKETRNFPIDIGIDANIYALFKAKYFKSLDFVLLDKNKECIALYGKFSRNKTNFHIEYIFLSNHLVKHSQNECLKIFLHSVVKLSDTRLLSITFKKTEKNVVLYEIFNDFVKQYNVDISILIK